jgi:hypothetical protein
VSSSSPIFDNRGQRIAAPTPDAAPEVAETNGETSIGAGAGPAVVVDCACALLLMNNSAHVAHVNGLGLNMRNTPLVQDDDGCSIRRCQPRLGRRDHEPEQTSRPAPKGAGRAQDE